MLKPLLIFTLLLPTLASARIGESPDQCATRYGAPQVREESAGLVRTEHRKSGVTISCFFDSGKCVCLSFATMVPSRVALMGQAGSAAKFTPAHVATILEANRGGSAWKKLPGEDPLGPFQHITEDGAIQATVHDDVIVIQTTANIDARKKLTAPDAITKALEGI